jgi:hypothetical protein
VVLATGKPAKLAASAAFRSTIHQQELGIVLLVKWRAAVLAVLQRTTVSDVRLVTTLLRRRDLVQRSMVKVLRAHTHIFLHVSAAKDRVDSAPRPSARREPWNANHTKSKLHQMQSK